MSVRVCRFTTFQRITFDEQALVLQRHLAAARSFSRKIPSVSQGFTSNHRQIAMKPGAMALPRVSVAAVLAAAAARPAPRTAQSRTSLLLGHQLPMPLGDDVDSAVPHLYGGLIVNQIRWKTHLGDPFLPFGHRHLGGCEVIKVRRYRKFEQ